MRNRFSSGAENSCRTSRSDATALPLSAFNAQPWRFAYARRGTEHWEKFVGLLMPYNQGWAEKAAALVYLLSAPTFIPDGKTEPQGGLLGVLGAQVGEKSREAAR